MESPDLNCIPLKVLILRSSVGRKLKGAELWYPTHEKELLAIKEALEKWRIYVDNGMTITVITDHDSLKYMNTMKNSSK